jgi:hypothetical protein
VHHKNSRIGNKKQAGHRDSPAAIYLPTAMQDARDKSKAGLRYHIRFVPIGIPKQVPSQRVGTTPKIDGFRITVKSRALRGAAVIDFST